MNTNQSNFVVIIPCLNEEKHIEFVVKKIRNQTSAPIWIYDGGSTDSTPKILEELTLQVPRVGVYSNTRRTQAAAVNTAVRKAANDGYAYFVRIDAHANYNSDFIETVISSIQETGSDSVVVPLVTIGGNKFQDASADVFNSALGNGGSPHRSTKQSGPVEHGHHAAMRVSSFLDTGGYDEKLLANEDANLDARLVSAGRTIHLENRSPVEYIPRANPRALSHQYFRNGYFRLVSTISLGVWPNLRQILPAILSLIVLITPFAVLFNWLFMVPVAAYALLVTILAIIFSSKKNVAHVCRMILASVTAHIAFGVGYNYAAFRYFQRKFLIEKRPESA